MLQIKELLWSYKVVVERELMFYGMAIIHLNLLATMVDGNI